jgi:hypothetical protein
MFTKYKKRTFLAFLTNFAGQATGIQIVSNYGPILYQSLGYSTTVSLIVQGKLPSMRQAVANTGLVSWLALCGLCFADVLGHVRTCRNERSRSTDTG